MFIRLLFLIVCSVMLVTPASAQEEEEVDEGGTPAQRLSSKYPMDRANAALAIALDPAKGKDSQERLIELLTDRAEVYYPPAAWQERRYFPTLEPGHAIDLVGFVAARALAVQEVDPARLTKIIEDTSDAFLLDNAAYVAGMRKVNAVKDRLLRHLKTVEADPALPAEGAIEALGRLGDKSAVPPLVAFLEGEIAKEEARWDRLQVGAEALGRLRDTRAIPLLLKIASSPEKRVEVVPFAGFAMVDAAVGALATSKDARAAPALLEYVKAFQVLVALQAGARGGKEAIADKHSDTLRVAIAALADHPPAGASEALLPWLKYPRVRGTAARTLRTLGEAASFDGIFLALLSMGCLPPSAKPEELGKAQGLAGLDPHLACLKDDPYDPERARVAPEVTLRGVGGVTVPVPSASPSPASR